MGVQVTRGNRNIRWIETFCRIPEGKFVGQPVKLRAFQKRVIRGIYDSPTRRAIISFGRKNAKTTLAAFLCLLHAAGPEAKRNSQLYSAAQSRDQAGILFKLMCQVIRMSPDLDACITIRESSKVLVCSEIGTTYRALSAEATTAYGLSPVFTVHDELGQVVGPRSGLYDALETASAAQEQPLTVIISTQAPSDSDLLSLLIDDAKGKHDPQTKLFLYTADPDIDPFSLKAIKAANPALGDFMNRDEVLAQADTAKRMPSAEAAYRNLVLNQRISKSNPFVVPTVWKANGGAPDLDVLRHYATSAGLDLSSKLDLTATVFTARDDEGVVHVVCDFFAPAQGVEERSRRDRVPYDHWAQLGYLTLTPGSSVDYEYVATHLAQRCEEFNVTVVKFDRWRIDLFKQELEKIGAVLPLEPHGQGFRDMSPALEVLENDLVNHRIRHGMNPILTWCSNNAIAVVDPAGNRKLDKSKSSGRIDGMVALAMADGALLVPDPPEYKVLFV